MWYLSRYRNSICAFIVIFQKTIIISLEFIWKCIQCGSFKCLEYSYRLIFLVTTILFTIKYHAKNVQPMQIFILAQGWEYINILSLRRLDNCSRLFRASLEMFLTSNSWWFVPVYITVLWHWYILVNIDHAGMYILNPFSDMTAINIHSSVYKECVGVIKPGRAAHNTSRKIVQS